MNWAYLGTAALLPLVIALALAMLIGGIHAVILNRQGGASRSSYTRLIRTLILAFSCSFMVASLWSGWPVWKGLAGAALGRGEDLRRLGLARSSGKHFLVADEAKAAHWFRRAAEAGDPQGRLWYARVLLAGKGTSKDPDAALLWARRAGEQGDADAQVFTGDLLAERGSPESTTWYRAARLSYEKRLPQAEAFLAIGLLHEAGKGTPPDPIEGLAWMYLARRHRLDPFKGVLIQMSEVRLDQAQRARARERAKVLLASLPLAKQPALNPP